MKRLISLCVLIAAVIGVVSCDDNGTDGRGDGLYFLSSMTNTYYDLHKEYIYDSEKNLAQIVEVYFSDSYSGDGDFDITDSSSSDFDTYELFEITYTTGGATLVDESGNTTELQFNEDGYVSKLTKYYGVTEDYNITYSYDSKGYLESFVKIENDATTTSTCMWSGGNLVSVVDTAVSTSSTTYDKIDIVYGSTKATSTNFDMNYFYVIAEEYQQLPSKWFGKYSVSLSTKIIYYSKSGADAAWEAITNGDVENSYTRDSNGCVNSYSSSSAGGNYSMSFTYTILD